MTEYNKKFWIIFSKNPRTQKLHQILQTKETSPTIEMIASPNQQSRAILSLMYKIFNNPTFYTI